jgi:hypothetical protein
LNNFSIADAEDVTKPRGAEGFDNRFQTMKAIFIARGAAFNEGFIAEPF